MAERKIRKIIGTGGIGKGLFFLSRENEVLGRNESRMAELSDAKDYCKLHIVFHYLSSLLAPDIEVIPVGKVGRDENGALCKVQMKNAGMNTDWIEETSEHPTMLSICIQYPDKSGCNITSDNSACQEVDSKYILKTVKGLEVDEDTVVVALPEVSLESRIELLRYGKKQGAFCAASCQTAEIREFVKLKGPGMCDLIALNQEETAALAGMRAVTDLNGAKAAADKILKEYPHLYLWLTVGAEGSLLAAHKKMIAYPALPGIKVKNTGGAGDASLAGLLTGFCLGLPLWEEQGDGPKGYSAGELAVLLAGMSVESADSINMEINWEKIQGRAAMWKAGKRGEELIW